MKLLLTLLGLCSAVSQVLAWGVVGHEVVATIAQIHLFPSTNAKIKEILPSWTGGRLAAIASWPDRIRQSMPWSSELHYVSPLHDDPPHACAFDMTDVKSPRNVISAISNYTARLAQTQDDFDLRFLVHYIGDVHQPLHLMLRERGGNGDPVLFEHRHYSLHGVWDTQIIAKHLRTQTNYTRPLPSRQIESVLRDSIYDPYIRFILWEGVRLWWKDDLKKWLECPPSPAQAHLDKTNQIRLGVPVPPNMTTSYTACPAHWANPVHSYTCTHVFPHDYDQSEQPLREVGGDDYYGKIRKEHVMELLLAQAGLRLAATLNGLFGSEQDRALGLIAL